MAAPLRSGGEKNTNWEGGYRVPAMVRWPGLVKPGTEINEVFSAEDWLQTLLARGWRDGSCGQAEAGCHPSEPRASRSISTATTSASCLRTEPGSARKGVLLLDRRRRTWRACATTSGSWPSWSSASTGFDVWQDPMVTLRVPKLFRPGPIRSSAPTTRGWATGAAHRSHFPAGAGAGVREQFHQGRWSSSRRARSRARSTSRAC